MDWSGVDWTEGLQVKAGPMTYGLTEATPETARYWESIASDGTLQLKWCAACESWNHPRSVLCATCLAEPEQLSWREPRQSGTVYSLSTVHHAAFEELADQVPYHLGIVLMEGDVPIFARVVGGPDRDPAIGDTVGVGVQEIFGKILPVFEVENP